MDDFKDVMSQWIEIKKHIDMARSDLKVLVDREKVLRKNVQEYMKEEQIDTCTTKDAKVVFKTRKVKTGFSKNLVKTGLLRYFNGDEDRANYVFKIILECADVKEKDGITCKLLEK